MIPAPQIAEDVRKLHEIERLFLQFDVDIKRLWKHIEWGHGWPVGGIPLDGGLGTTTSTTGGGADCDAGFCCAGPVSLNAGVWTNAAIGSLPCPGFGGLHSLPFATCFRSGSALFCTYLSGSWVVEIESRDTGQRRFYASLNYAGVYTVVYQTGLLDVDACGGPYTLNRVAESPTGRCNPPATVEVSF